jgi:hypothetical protein
VSPQGPQTYPTASNGYGRDDSMGKVHKWMTNGWHPFGTFSSILHLEDRSL